LLPGKSKNVAVSNVINIASVAKAAQQCSLFSSGAAEVTVNNMKHI
jgi:hypothetical protein